MPGIKATNSKGLKIISCKFSGFDTDIELENCEDFLSVDNTFSRDNHPQQVLNHLIDAIKQSSLPPAEQLSLFDEIIDFLKQGAAGKSKQKSLMQKIGRYVGDKAIDYLVQLAAMVSAGLIVK